MLQPLLLILLVIPWLLRHHVIAYQITDYGVLCPYSNLCQKNAQLTRQVDEEKWPCCSPCSCTDNCYLIKRCCPDKTWTNDTVDMSTSIEASCPPQQDLYNRYFGTKRIYNTNNFHVISTCPEQLSHKNLREAAHRCEHGDDTLHDVHFVSDKQNETLYFNKYCALCNGVQNVVPWRLKAICGGGRTLDVKSVKERDIYTLSNCDISSVPPTEDVGFKFLCKSNTIDRCNVTGNWDIYDPALDRKCFEYDIPFTTYNYRYSYVEEYSNVYCYLCNAQKGASVINLCNTPFTDNERVFFYSFSFIISTSVYDREQLGRSETPCKNLDIFDHIMLKCRELLCPPSFIPENGECLPIVEDVDGMVFHIYRQFNITFETFQQLQIGDNKWLYMIRRISAIQKLKSHGCLLCGISISVDPDGFIISETTVASTKTCSVETLLGILHKSIKRQVKFHWESENLNLEIHLKHGNELWENFISSIVVSQEQMCERGAVFTVDLVHCPGFKYDLNELDSGSLDITSRNKILAKSTQLDNSTYMICLQEYERLLDEFNSGTHPFVRRCYIMVFLLQWITVIWIPFY